MKSGELNRRITLVRKSPTIVRRDGTTGTGPDFTLSVWAKYTPVKGADRTVGDAQTASVDTMFTVRRRTDFTPTPNDFIRYAGAEYDISEVRELGLNECWQIMATCRRIAALPLVAES